MAYFLLKETLGQSPEIEISKEEYTRIQAACDGIWTLIGIEENWDNLVRNYTELEMEFLKAATGSMVLTQCSFHEMHEMRLGFSRRLSSLLTSYKSYLDQTPHHLKKLGGNTFKDSFDQLKRCAYDNHFSYRLMEGLRNYAQHRDVPLHGARLASSWIKPEGARSSDDELMRYTASANIDLDKLKSDEKTKPNLRAEIEDGANHIDVVTVTRDYIEVLGAMHLELRESTNSLLTEWKSIVQETIARYGSVNNGNVIGLCITEHNDSNAIKPKIAVFNDPVLYLEKLMLRNGSMVNLTKRYVTNEIAPARKSSLTRKPR
jgi:hypothetical protein